MRILSYWPAFMCLATMGVFACSRTRPEKVEPKVPSPPVKLDVKQISQSITPDKALAAALEALANAKVPLWDDYTITIRRSRTVSNQWIVTIVAIPETPDKQLMLIVDEKGQVSINTVP